MIPRDKQIYFEIDAKEGMPQKKLRDKYNLSKQDVRYYLTKFGFHSGNKDLRKIVK
jgi:hypothetical protein